MCESSHIIFRYHHNIIQAMLYYFTANREKLLEEYAPFDYNHANEKYICFGYMTFTSNYKLCFIYTPCKEVTKDVHLFNL